MKRSDRNRAGRSTRARHARLFASCGLLLSWGLCVPGVLSALALALQGRIDPVEISGWAWLIDTAATLGAQSLVAVTAALIVAALTRRWACGLVSLVSILVIVLGVLGVERAQRTSCPEGPVVKLLAYNALSDSERGAEQLDQILGSGADVVILNEPSRSLLDAIRADGRTRASYPHFRLPDRADAGFRIVLSRYPIARNDDGFGFLWPDIRESLGYHGARVVRVDTPQGPFVLAGVQFRSPRNRGRWVAGNLQARETAAGLSIIADQTLLPVVVVGDLNASPLGVRSRELARATGLVRVKPALLADGTYPAALPWPARIPIDGALVSPEISLVSYSTIAVPGSDHRAVWLELALPGQAVPSP